MTLTNQDQHPLCAAAREWYDAGYCVVPAHEDGGKRPWGLWKQYQSERLPIEEVEALLNTGNYTGIGVITGHVSGNVEMIELEGRAVRNGSLDFLRDLAKRNHIDELFDRLIHGCSELSPNVGHHFFARCSDEPIPDNMKLARQKNRETGEVEVLSETRGNGGFVIVAPSPGRKGHPEGMRYIFFKGQPANTPEMTGDELRQLRWLFSQLDDMPEEAAKRTKAPTVQLASKGDELTPWADWAAKTTWAQILEPHGWQFMYSGQRDGHPNDTWCRPGKKPSDGPSATTAGEEGAMYVFTTSTTLPSEQGMSKLFVYAHYNHNDDMSAAGSALYAAGYGDRHEVDLLPAWEGPNPLHVPNVLIDPIMPTSSTPSEEAAAEEPLTYADLGWIISGERRDPPPPTHLSTTKGNQLFYRARINGLFGDPETAKSWIAMSAITEALNEGERAAYLDVDHNGANEIASRMMALGARRELVADPDTFRIYEPEHGKGLLEFIAQMHEWKPNIVAVDSLGEIVPMLGLKSTDNDDLTKAIRAILKPLAHVIEACVITIDHLPKGKDARDSGYAIGGIAKKRAVDGSYFLCEAIHPPAPGKVGKIRLTVEKDRHGHVRGAAAGRVAGEFILDSTTADVIDWKIDVPAATPSGGILHTGAMSAISAYLENQPEQSAKSINQIVKDVDQISPFSPETIRLAVYDLQEMGAVAIEKGGQGKAAKVVLINSYAELGEVNV
jgi:hypothetical protein